MHSKVSLEPLNCSMRDFIFLAWSISLIFMIFFIVANFFKKYTSIDDNSLLFLSNTILQISGLIALFFFFKFSDCKPHFNLFSNWKKPLIQGGLGFLIFIPIMISIVYLWTAFLNLLGIVPSEQMVVMEYKKISNLYVKIIAVTCICFIAPIFEEILFRGILYRIFKNYFGIAFSAILVSIIFALIHHSIFASIPIFFLSIFFVYVYEYSKDIKAPIFAHFLFNLCNVLFSL